MGAVFFLNTGTSQPMGRLVGYFHLFSITFLLPEGPSLGGLPIFNVRPAVPLQLGAVYGGGPQGGCPRHIPSLGVFKTTPYRAPWKGLLTAEHPFFHHRFPMRKPPPGGLQRHSFAQKGGAGAHVPKPPRCSMPLPPRLLAAAERSLPVLFRF